MEFPLMYFSPVFDFIEKPVIWFAQQAYISTHFEAGLTKKIFFQLLRLFGSRNSRMDWENFKEDILKKIWSDMVCLSKPYADHITSNFLKFVFHKFYLVHSWIPWPIFWNYQLILKCLCKSSSEKKNWLFKIFHTRNFSTFYGRVLWR